MNVHISARATADLAAIRSWIAADDAAAAQSMVAKLLQRMAKLTAMPRVGRMVPEIGQERIREVLEGKYRIVYRIDDDKLVVLTVFERHRQLRL